MGDYSEGQPIVEGTLSFSRFSGKAVGSQSRITILHVARHGIGVAKHHVTAVDDLCFNTGAEEECEDLLK